MAGPTVSFRLSDPSAESSLGSDASSKDNASMIAFGVDEYSEIAWLVRADQSIDAFCLAGGERIRSWEPPKGKSEAEGVVSARVRVAKVDEQQGSVLLGLETGQIRPVLCNWDVRFHNRSELGKDLLESIDGVGEGGVGDRARLFEGRSEEHNV